MYHILWGKAICVTGYAIRRGNRACSALLYGVFRQIRVAACHVNMILNVELEIDHRRASLGDLVDFAHLCIERQE